MFWPSFMSYLLVSTKYKHLYIIKKRPSSDLKSAFSRDVLFRAVDLN